MQLDKETYATFVEGEKCISEALDEYVSTLAALDTLVKLHERAHPHGKTL